LIITVLAMQSAAHSKDGAAETAAATVAAETSGEDSMDLDPEADSSVLAAAVGETASSDSREQPGPDEPAIPGEGTEDPARADLEEIVDSRVKDVEASLREEYERQLAELRSRLAASRRAAEVEASSVSQGDQAPSSQPGAGAAEPDSADLGATRTRPPASPTSGSSTSDAAGPQRTVTPPPAGPASPPVRTGATVLPAASTAPPPVSSPPADDPGAEQEPKPTAASPGADPQASQLSPGVDLPPTTTRQPAAGESAVGAAEASDDSSFEPPRLVESPRPVYPAAARRVRRAATVRVRVVVGPDGAVEDVELADEERAGFGLDQAALAAARRSEWTPATRLGEPVEASVVLTIVFQP
jgi:protein TonB